MASEKRREERGVLLSLSLFQFWVTSVTCRDYTPNMFRMAVGIRTEYRKYSYDTDSEQCVKKVALLTRQAAYSKHISLSFPTRIERALRICW